MSRDILYKYFPAERSNFFKLPEIRFSPTGEFNDPFEFKPAFDGVHNCSFAIYLPSKYNKNPAGREVVSGKNIEIIESYKYPGDPQVYKYRKRTAGILCLTEDSDNILMWSHYASGHTGFVVGFDATDRFFNRYNENEAPIRSLKRVEYRKDRPSLESENFDLSKFFYLKHIGWEYEKEWRLVIDLPDENSVNFDKIENTNSVLGIEKIPPSVIKEVVVGLHTPSDLINMAQNFVERQKGNVRLFKTKLHDSEYSLEYE